MSPQREGETPEMYLYRLEMTQEQHEDRLSAVEAVAMEARKVATDTRGLVVDMPSRVIKAIDERDEARRKEQKMNGRELLFLAMGILGTIGGLAGAVASIKQAFGG